MAVLNLHTFEKPRIPPGAIYIGRANPRLGLSQSPFANPFVVKGVRDTAARAEVIEKYRGWLWDKIRSEHFTLDDLVALDGKHLVCYCAPMACHGHVLEKAVKWAVARKAALDAGEPVDPIPGPVKSPRPLPSGSGRVQPNPGFPLPRPAAPPAITKPPPPGRPPKLR